jgi:hypothetical protein
MGVLSWAVAVSAVGTVRPAQSSVAMANRPAIENVRLELIRIPLPKRDNASRPLLATSLFTFALTLRKSDLRHAAGACVVASARAVPWRQTSHESRSVIANRSPGDFMCNDLHRCRDEMEDRLRLGPRCE